MNGHGRLLSDASPSLLKPKVGWSCLPGATSCIDWLKLRAAPTPPGAPKSYDQSLWTLIGGLHRTRPGTRRMIVQSKILDAAR